MKSLATALAVILLIGFGVAQTPIQPDEETLCRKAAQSTADQFSKMPSLHDGATSWDYDYHYVRTNNLNAKCFIWFRTAHRETFSAPGAIPKRGLRFEDIGETLLINLSDGEKAPVGPFILKFESVVLDKGTDTEVSKVFYCEVDDRLVHENGHKTECQAWDELRNLTDYVFGIKYTGRLR